MGSGIKVHTPDMMVVRRKAYVGHVCSKRSARHVCHKTIQYVGKKRVRILSTKRAKQDPRPVQLARDGENSGECRSVCCGVSLLSRTTIMLYQTS